MGTFVFREQVDDHVGSIIFHSIALSDESLFEFEIFVNKVDQVENGFNHEGIWIEGCFEIDCFFGFLEKIIKNHSLLYM